MRQLAICLAILCLVTRHQQVESLTPTSATTSTTASPNAPCPETSTSPDRQPVTLNNGIRALCDSKTDGGNWIVIQRRAKGDVDFYRGWDEYVAGFGDVTGDHWMGLQDVHRLCPLSKPCRLRIYLQDDHVYSPQTTVWAEYSSFSLAGFTENYRLSLSGYNISTSTVGDAMLTNYNLNNMYFSTRDRDNDRYYRGGSCAVKFHGGWWYNSCSMSNLNGRWGSRAPGGLMWDGINVKHRLYATYTEMKVRTDL